MEKKYSNLTDDELITIIREDNSALIDLLMDKYKDMVRIKARSMYILGAKGAL